jgi:hypothetical protein
MKEHFAIELNGGDIALDKVGVEIKEVVILLQSKLRSWTNGIVQFPPNDITGPILSTIYVFVAIRGNGVGFRRSICWLKRKLKVSSCFGNLGWRSSPRHLP